MCAFHNPLRKRFTTALLVNGFLTSQQSARLGISWILTSFQELHQPCLAIHQLYHYYTHSTYAFMERKGWLIHTNKRRPNLQLQRIASPLC